MPSLKTPEQCERWSDLMPLMTWQLWLARDLVTQYRLPWQSATLNLSPGRVAQSMFLLLMQIGTPTSSPKQRGKSNGRITGFKSHIPHFSFYDKYLDLFTTHLRNKYADERS